MKIYIIERGRVDEIRTFIANKLGIHHSGFEVIEIETLPKNSAGKIEYSKLK